MKQSSKRVAENWVAVEQGVADAIEHVGRQRSDVRIVGVTQVRGRGHDGGARFSGLRSIGRKPSASALGEGRVGPDR